jgi:conjugal transfer pilus assembly protein TraF
MKTHTPLTTEQTEEQIKEMARTDDRRRHQNLGILGCLALIALCLIASIAQAQQQQPDPVLKTWWDRSVWENPERDYKWYPPDPEVSQPAPLTPPKVASPEVPKKSLKPKKVDDFKTAKEVQAHLAELKDKAVMKPTEKNVKDYYAFQFEVLNQTTVFADVARRVIWASPEIDTSVKRPYNNAGATAYRTNQPAKERMSVAKLSQSHGMFFFYRSDCPYCHEMGPVVKEFARQSGMFVQAISLDGGGLPGFPTAQPNNGMAEQLQVSTVPALYLVERKTKNVQPIAFGVTAINDIVERIHVLTTTTPGQEF